MKVSQRGLDLIKKYEGFYTDAYLCPANVWTIGFGTTVYSNGQKVKKGDKITQSEASKLLEKQVNEHASSIFSYVKIPLNQNQFDALASFQYNLGKHILSKDKSLANYINDKDWNNVTRVMKLYNKGDGKVLQGLVKRRNEEAELFITPIKTNGGENMVNFICPIDNPRVTSVYGMRTHPVTKKRQLHAGVDLVSSKEKNPPVHATCDGTVRLIKDMGTSGYGKYIIITHIVNGIKYETVYAHLKSYSVKVGQKVEKGNVIGILGNTGIGTGDHLHYEVHKGTYNYGNGTYPTSFDPMKVTDLKKTPSTSNKSNSPTPSTKQKERMIKLLKDSSSTTLRNEFVKDLEKAYADKVFTDKKWIELAKSGEMTLADAFLLQNRINKK